MVGWFGFLVGKPDISPMLTSNFPISTQMIRPQSRRFFPIGTVDPDAWISPTSTKSLANPPKPT